VESPKEDSRMEVLIADDDPVSLHLLKAKLLKWQYKVITVTDGLEAWRLLQSDSPPRLAILDWMMPGLEGLEVCQNVRTHRTTPYIYILLLTSRRETSDLVAGLEAGADDYLTKPFNVEELEVRLRAGRRILTLQEELMAAHESLRIQATHDPLTGMLNRGAVLDHLERELARARREHGQLSLILVDLELNIVFLVLFWILHKKPEFKLKYGIYWDKEKNPHCPNCKIPIGRYADYTHGKGYLCRACNKIFSLADPSGNHVNPEQAISEL